MARSWHYQIQPGAVLDTSANGQVHRMRVVEIKDGMVIFASLGRPTRVRWSLPIDFLKGNFHIVRRAKGASALLTKRQVEILTLMRDSPEDEDSSEIVYERGEAWIGLSRIAPRTVFALLRLCAIKAVSGGHRGIERYVINETGRKLLERHGKGAST